MPANNRSATDPLLRIPPFVPALDEKWLHAEEVGEDSPADSSSAKLDGHLHLKRFSPVLGVRAACS